jgi:hypothetical protein
MNKQKENKMSTLIRILILSWSAALLTASYAGALSKMDPTFIATVFTASAATFGINTMKKGGDDDDEKDEKPARRDEFVETPPTPREQPVWEEPVQQRTEELPLVDTGYKDSTLEERVEALEAIADEDRPTYSRGDL